MSNITFAEAAYKILKQARKALTADEITSIALNQNMISTMGKTPSATMSARLYVDIKTQGDKSKFISKHDERIRFRKPFNLFGWWEIVHGQKG